MMTMLTTRVFTRRMSATASIALLTLLAAGCGADDEATSTSAAAADAAGVTDVTETSGEETETGGDTSEADATQGDGESIASPAAGYGLGDATVSFGDEVHRFAITSADDLSGQCRVLFGVLVVDLPLVESNGVALEDGDGWLRMDIELEDVADFEPYAELAVPGGQWFAGASETASLSGVGTPEITLTGEGLTVSGTQSMVPLAVGPGEPIEATIEATCE